MLSKIIPSNTAAAWLRLIRVGNSSYPMLVLFIGYIIGSKSDSYTKLFIAGLAYITAHSAVTIWNDIEDREIDIKNNVQTILTANLRTLRTAKIVTGGLLAITSILCFLLPLKSALVVGIFILLSWAYNSRPLQLSRRPLASVIILGLCYGTLPFFIGVALLPQIRFSPDIIALGIFLGLGRASISLLKDYKDVRGDAVSNKRTFLLVFGRRSVRLCSMLLAVIGYVGSAFIINKITGENIVLFWMITSVLLYWLILERMQLYKHESDTALNSVFERCIRLQLLFDGFFVVWLSIYFL